MYQKNLYCLQDVLSDNDLSECDAHWVVIEQYLKNITSYEFYCQAHNPNTRNLVPALERLRSCYEVIFSLKCNDVTSSMMSELIRRAFDDPFYLRFAYRADCHLHKKDSIKRSHPANRRHGGHVHRGNGRRADDNTPAYGADNVQRQAPRHDANGADSAAARTNQLAASSGVSSLNTHGIVQTLHVITACVLVTLCFNSRFVLR